MMPTGPESQKRPDAVIMPAGTKADLCAREVAKAALLDRLRQCPAQGLEKSSRDELYDV